MPRPAPVTSEAAHITRHEPQMLTVEPVTSEIFTVDEVVDTCETEKTMEPQAPSSDPSVSPVLQPQVSLERQTPSMDTLVSPTSMSPGIATVGTQNGPYFASVAPAEAVHFATNASWNAAGAATNVNGFNSVRDSIAYAELARQNDAQFRELMSEFRNERAAGVRGLSVQAQYSSVPPQQDVKAVIESALAGNELIRLRAEVASNATNAVLEKILSAISALQPTPTK